MTVSLRSDPSCHSSLVKGIKCLLFKVDEENVVFIGGVILRHITQLVCNASAIYEVIFLVPCHFSYSCGSVRCKQVVGWQHLYHIKAWLLWVIENASFPAKTPQAIPGTSAATCQLMEPHCSQRRNVTI